MKKFIIYGLSALALTLASCTEKGWSVSGKIENAPNDTKIAVEGFGAMGWYNIDSVEIASDGSFKYQSPDGAPYPDIYRVSLDGRAIYFPIDSLDKVTITANALNFDGDYSLDGSEAAKKMMEIDKSISQFVAANGVGAALTDSVFRRQINATIADDQTGIIAYYLINKTIGDQPLYSTTSRADVRMLGALANKFETMFPGDPRTAILTQRFLSARAALPDAKVQVLEANESGLIDLAFYDAKGKQRRLSDVVKGAGVTLLSFTTYNMDASLAYNVELNRLYDIFKGNNIEIYQIAIDNDEVEWRSKAQNLPWVAVRANPDEVQSLLSIYNIGVLPTTFVIDGNGDIVERVDTDPSQLESAVRKHL